MLVGEIVLIMGSSLAGALSVAVFNRLYNNRRIRNSHLKKQQQEHFVKPLNTAKQELQSLQFEKNLVSEAITRVYEAMQEKKIDVIERDRLLTKYKRQLNSYNERIAKLQSTIDLKEIGEVRNNLVSLLEERIKGIDQKLDELSYKTGIPSSDNNNNNIARTERRQEEKRGTVAIINNNNTNNNTQQRQKSLKDDLSLTAPSQLTTTQKSADKRRGGGKKTEEKNIEELQKEIMESLARLEQVELDDNEEEQEVLHKPSIDKKEEEVGGNNNKKLDALANF